MTDDVRFKPGQTFSPVDDLVRRAKRRMRIVSTLASVFLSLISAALVALAGGPFWACVAVFLTVYAAL
jgi:hypothetical protein